MYIVTFISQMILGGFWYILKQNLSVSIAHMFTYNTLIKQKL